MSRWTYIEVNQELRCRDYDDGAQHFKSHGGSQIETLKGNTYVPLEFVKDRPVVAFRTYADSATAIVNLSY